MDGIPSHWHYVSAGLSDLHGDGRVHAYVVVVVPPCILVLIDCVCDNIIILFLRVFLIKNSVLLYSSFT